MDGQLAGLVALEDAIDVDRGLPELIAKFGTVAYQPSIPDKGNTGIDCRNPISSRELDDRLAMGRSKARSY